MSKFESLSAEDIGYILNLPYHLVQAGMNDELIELLTDFEFLEHKVLTLGPQLLIEDYNLALQPNVQISERAKKCFKAIKGAIRLSAHILELDRTQLAPQLLGRLLSCEAPEIKILLEQAVSWKGLPWLRPLTTTLTPPGGLLLRTLTAHTAEVNAVAITLDGQHIVSGSMDKTLKVWDLDGRELRTLKGHQGAVTAATVFPDGQYIISSSLDKTLKIWDLASGVVITSFRGDGWLYSCATNHLGTIVIVGEKSGKTHFLHFESGDI
ncbi:hypothetical protein NIES2101_29010 [Calothrix sp. HK-06]|nr:hypothetical protein NIES2101_29010 [Calothrix sp. HK-06]